MQRRTLILGGTILAAGLVDGASVSAATPEHVPATINNRGTRLVRLRFKPGGRVIWEAWCAELERRREETLATLQAEGVRTEGCYISDDGEELYYFEDAPEYEKSRSVFKNSHFAIDAEHTVKLEQCLERIGQLKTLLELHNPLMS